jgi:uncharacterized membrane protein
MQLDNSLLVILNSLIYIYIIFVEMYFFEKHTKYIFHKHNKSLDIHHDLLVFGGLYSFSDVLHDLNR